MAAAKASYYRHTPDGWRTTDMHPQFYEHVDRSIEQTLAAHSETVDAWRIGTPKTWGLLAGQAVLECRRRVGRNLTETERRIVWDRLWRALLDGTKRDA